MDGACQHGGWARGGPVRPVHRGSPGGRGRKNSGLPLRSGWHCSVWLAEEGHRAAAPVAAGTSAQPLWLRPTVRSGGT
jgi:hypothetical protein